MKTKKKKITSSSIDYRPFYGVLLVFLAMFNILDAALTSLMVGFGYALEANPMMEYIINIHPLLFFFFKIAVGAWLIPMLWKIAQKNKGQKTIWLLFTMYGLVTINNVISALVVLYFEFLIR